MLSGLDTSTAPDQDADDFTAPIPVIDPVTNPIPVIETLRNLAPGAVAAAGAGTIDRYTRQAAVLAVLAGLVMLAALVLAVGGL